MTRPPVRTTPREPTSGSGGPKRGPRASVKPTPRELRVLKVVADGIPLTEAARRLEVPVGYVSHVLSCLYRRLGIKDIGAHPQSHDRRRLAVRICKTNGWWGDDE